jgi:hypothetical protein
MNMMAWGMLQYESAYVDSGELGFGLENLKWGTDYMLKASRNSNLTKKHAFQLSKTT